MKSRYVLRLTAMLIICLSSAFVSVAQRNQKAQERAIPPGPCRENTRLCLQRMRAQINVLRAYTNRLRPGDKVSFNPQPDPPGSPDPWFRRANEAYIILQKEFADLSASSPWGQSQWTWSQADMDAWKNNLSEAQGKLDSLGQASDSNSANLALNQLSAATERLSGVAGKRRYKKSSSSDNSGGSTTRKRH